MIDNRVDKLKKDFGARTREAETLRQKLEQTEEVLDKAETLLSKLSGEQTRWERTVKELQRSRKNLPMTCLIAAGFSTYLVKSSEEVRARALSLWQGLVAASSTL